MNCFGGGYRFPGTAGSNRKKNDQKKEYFIHISLFIKKTQAGPAFFLNEKKFKNNSQQTIHNNTLLNS